MGWFDGDFSGGSSFGFDDSAFKSTGSSLFSSGGGFGGGSSLGSGTNLNGGFGGGSSWGGGTFDWGGGSSFGSSLNSGKFDFGSSWVDGFVSSPSVASTASIFGTTADKLFGAVSKTLGDGWDWYQRQSDGTKGLLADVIKGAAGAYLMGRQYDKQREAEKSLRREERAALERQREVPVLNVGSGRRVN